MEKYIAKYAKVGQGAWAVKALYDETVTALLTQNFSDIQGFIEVFDLICGDFGGKAAYLKLQKAANLLALYSTQSELVKQYLKASENLRLKPLAPSCINLSKVEEHYNSHQIISSRIEQICSFLNCNKHNLEICLKREIESDVVPTAWDLQVSHLYSIAYEKWFVEIANEYLSEFLPIRQGLYAPPVLKVVDWSSEVWRCWRSLDHPTLVDPGIFRPSQFFVWHIVHDSVHVWQMQSYGTKWSNVLSPNEYLFLEAQAMCVERILLNLLLNSVVELPSWYPAPEKAIILRLLIGLLEREIRLDLDLQVHLHGQNFAEWLKDICKLTQLSSTYFQGLTAELLGMPGFCAAYTVVTDNFQSLSSSRRRKMLQEFPNITYTSLGSVYADRF